MSQTAPPSRTHYKPKQANESAVPASRDVFFRFEGKKTQGLAGESIAKALFRNGIRTLSHSVKYGRARSIHCGRGRCVMCHVEVDGVSGVKSCLTPLAAGMVIRRQDYRPFYGWWITGVLGRVQLPAGFYYRMFTRPRIVRRVFVDAIRRMAGVGKIDHSSNALHETPPPNPSFARLKHSYDIVVVGAGVSGLAAALGAADAGAQVLLVDEYGVPGGHSIGRGLEPGGIAARDDLLRRVQHAAGIETASGTIAQGFYPPNRLLLGHARHGESEGGLNIVAAKAFVFATGAQDLVPLFENNDLPGVFGARGLRLFLERDGLVPGRSAVVYGAAVDSGLRQTMNLLREWDIAIKAILVADVDGPHDGYLGDTRGDSLGDSLGDSRLYTGAKLVRAEGRGWISRAVFETGASTPLSLPCDLLCIAVPGQPAFELAQQAGFRYGFSPDSALREDLEIMTPAVDVLDDLSIPPRYLVGEASGRFDWNSKIEHASSAGAAAAKRAARRR
jgi:sarcosine oxidase subunit alpha